MKNIKFNQIYLACSAQALTCYEKKQTWGPKSRKAEGLSKERGFLFNCAQYLKKTII